MLRSANVAMNVTNHFSFKKPHFSYVLKPNISDVDMKDWKYNKSFTNKILSIFEKSKGYYLLYIFVLFCTHLSSVVGKIFIFFRNFFFFIFNHSSAYRRQQAFASATDRHFLPAYFVYVSLLFRFFLSFRIQR